MKTNELLLKCEQYLKTLCKEIPERCVGSEGNRKATAFLAKEISSFEWETEMPEFDAIDWIDGGVFLQATDKVFTALVSPYSLGCDVKAELAAVSTIEELERINVKDKILLLHGEIAKEQIMPKNFVFYNPEHHQKIISLLEKSGVKAIIAATGKDTYCAGGVYPFPLIEDGDFDIPSVYMTDVEGEKLLPHTGEVISLTSISKRVPGKGYNVIARKGKNPKERIVVTAHIDAKKGTPGAIDNATGVTILLLLTILLKDYNNDKQIEIVAFNGEDYYAVPGQMNYLMKNHERINEILLNINIDGAGYIEGGSAFSFFGLPDNIKAKADKIINRFPGINEGIQWVQGDHSIFVQAGRPAIAVTSKWFLDNINTQDVTHTPKDNLDIVDPAKLIEIASAIKELILEISGS